MASFNWKTGVSGDWSQASDWQQGVVPNATTADVTISSPGTYQVSIAQGESYTADSVTLDSANATLDIGGLLNLSGAKGDFFVDAGELEIGGSGTLANGTVVTSGGTFLLASGATLQDVTVKGALNVAANFTSAFITNGLKIQTGAGATPGTFNISGYDDTIYIKDSETLNNLVINLGSAGSSGLDSLYAQAVGAPVTIGSGATINTAGTANINYLQGNTFVNAGHINVGGSGLDIEPVDFVNSGTIKVTTAAVLTIDATTFKNSGTINIAGGVLALADSTSLAALGKISTSSGGIFDVTGSLDLGNGTLAIGGTDDIEVGASGTLANGTVVTSGGTFSLASGATLQDATVKGALNVAANFTSAFITNGLKIQTGAGATPGTFNISGYDDTIYIKDSETLNNLVINLGSAGSSGLDSLYAQAVGAPVTIGSGATINTAGTANINYLQGNTFVNAGHINVGGSGLDIEPVDFVNSGTIKVTTAAVLTIDATTFKNSGTINIAGGVLALADSTSLAALGKISTSSGGIFDVTGSLDLGNGTLAIGGTDDIEVGASGTLANGTVVTSGGTFSLASGATLQDATVKGALNVAANFTSAFITNGLKIQTGAGATPGTFNISGYDDTIYIKDSETLNNLVINLGSAGSSGLDSLYAQAVGAPVTIGSGATINTAGTANINYLQGNTFVNAGHINVGGSGLDIEPVDFVNSGTIKVTTAAVLTIDATTFKNSGTINIAGGVLALADSTSLAALGKISTSSGGIFDVTGSLDLGNGTLAIGGTDDIEVGASGTLANGTVVTSGGTFSLASGATLQDATVKGALNVAANFTSAFITNGLKIQTGAGATPGTFNISGYDDTIYIKDSETLNNLVINLGSAGSSGLDSLYAQAVGAPVTIGSGATINTAGTANINYLQGNTFVNAGHINVGGSGLDIEPVDFVNSGTIKVTTAAVLTIDATTFKNSGTINIAGGVLALADSTSLAALGKISTSSGGIFDVTGSLDLGNGTLAIGGTDDIEVGASGTLANGTVVTSGGTFSLASGATLQDATVKGALNVAANFTSAFITNGLKIQTGAGATPGTFNISGYDDTIYIKDSETLNNLVINLGSAGSSGLDSLYAQAVGAPVTIGSGATINTAGTANINYLQGNTFVNAGHINVGGSGLDIEPVDFVNSGTIKVTTAAVLTIDATTLVNSGLITAIGTGTAPIDIAAMTFTNNSGASLSGSGIISGIVTNNGSIIVSGSTLSIVDPISGTGLVFIGTNTDLVLEAGISSGEKIKFGGANSILTLDQPQAMHATLVSLAPADTIDLVGELANSATIKGNELVVSLSAGGTLGYTLASANPSDQVKTVSDGNGGSDIVVSSSGAMISAPAVRAGNDTARVGMSKSTMQFLGAKSDSGYQLRTGGMFMGHASATGLAELRAGHVVLLTGFDRRLIQNNAIASEGDKPRDLARVFPMATLHEQHAMNGTQPLDMKSSMHM